MNYDYCLRMIRALLSSPDSNEAQKKELFISYLRNIFADDNLSSEEIESKIDNLSRGAETYVSTLPSTTNQSTKGFIDTFSGTIVIEFKKDLKNIALYNEAINGLKKYIASLWNESGVESSFGAISSDGLNWYVWRPVPSEILDKPEYNSDLVKLELAEKVEISEANEANSRHLTHFLHRILFKENLTQVSSENLKRDFGLNSNLFSLVYEQILNIVKQASKTTEVDLAIELWNKQQTYNAINIPSIDIEAYAKQTYLLILSRLMVAANFKEKDTLDNKDDTLKDILNGEYFYNSLKLKNFVDYDFFGWIAQDDWVYEFIPIVRPLFHNLLTYDFSNSGQENLVQLIYDEMLPESRKSELGQTSTPSDLVDSVISNLFADESEFRYLDPACGCGSFIRSALSYVKIKYQDYGPNEKIRIIKNAVTGIDIDPIAVILSKSIWAITLADIIKDIEEPVEIPIYHADSLFITGDSMLSHQKDLDTQTTTIMFDDSAIEIPKRTLLNMDVFDSLIEWSNTKAKTIKEKYELKGNTQLLDPKSITEETLVNILGSDFCSELSDSEKELLANGVASLVNNLAERMIQDRDGIWAFVLSNNYRPSLLAGNFDIIATNPPWLTISSLPNVPYKDQLKSLSKAFKVNPRGATFLHSEISTIFALHNVKHFLKEDGKAAFIMPRSIFDADNHQPFRERKFNELVPFGIREIWDLADVENLFKLPSCVLFGEKNNLNTEKLSYIYSHFVSSLNIEDGSENGYLTLCTLADKNAWLKVDYDERIHVEGHEAYNSFREGADLFPRTGLFVDILEESQSICKITTADSEVKNTNNKRLKGIEFKGFTERQYIFQTVTSNNLLPFLIPENALPNVVLPVSEIDDRLMILNEDELIDKGHTHIHKWLQNINKKEPTKKDIYEAVNYRNKLTNQDYKQYSYLVHCGAGGSIPCAGIQRKHFSEYNFVADQTTYVYGTNDENEAYYLIGVINAYEAFSNTIEPFQARGDFGTRHIHKLIYKIIPEFDINNQVHNEIVTLAKQLEENAMQVVEENEEITNVYIRVQNRRTRLRNALNENLKNALNSKVLQILSAN
ncbi:hypothetical protein N780_10220 [Pontibacillus chungwhensis BH030062]|uniref:site-specific DNA-methyltransferase (adenine-specific) n=1 Tax=Pontibacillus chungwhensis BH030062 TaxID=1385513 RepID=A0A0A2USB4_9BACI|nr:N-6 DNA methylase [Pontibacillus chungwhensis]KGP89663.1 hypothetical protein N780_10220 [Pontibacillus chungwhensis BH030062]